MNRPSPSTLFRWTAILLLLTAGLWVLGHYSREYILPFAAWVHGLGPWGPVAFVAVYTFADVFFIPASGLTIAGGALFGFVGGVTYTFIGAMLGSVAAFFMGRYVLRPFITARLRRDNRFEQIDHAATRGGMKLVALLRLSPVLPYTVLNYALGVTRIRAVDYLLGTTAILPGILVYTYYGTVIANLAGLTPHRHHRGIGFYLMIASSILVTILVIIAIARIAHRHLIELERES